MFRPAWIAKQMHRAFVAALVAALVAVPVPVSYAAKPPPANPVLASIVPGNADPGSVIDLYGSGFGSKRTGDLVSFAGGVVGAVYPAWSDTHISVQVPAGAQSGGVSVTVDKVASNPLHFYPWSTPALDLLSPSVAGHGQLVTLSGASFGSVQSGSTVTFSGIEADVVSWSDTSIVVAVPDAPSGPVQVDREGVRSPALPFERTYAPVVSSVTPTAALVGSTVTIAGTGFEANQGSGSVSFDGVVASIVSWSDTSIRAVVPGDGPVVVTQNGLDSNAASFGSYVAPVLTSLTPARAPAGATVTLSGTDFGAQQGSGFVSFGAVSAVVSSWSDTSIDVVVPDVGDCDVAVTQNGVASGALAFDRIYPPAITSVTPSAALVGSTVIITGSGFETVQGLGSVTFGGVPATVTSWSDTAISAVVPGDGPIVVTQGALSSNAQVFASFLAPTLTSLSPSSAPAGAAVTLSGTDFGAAQGDGEVTFGGVPAIVSSWSDTSITVIVPDVDDCDVTVSQNGEASAALPFERTYAPVVSSVTPTAALVGSTVTIAGTGFEANQGSGSVSFDGVVASIVSWSDTSIRAVVPGDGPVVVTQNGLDSNAASFGSYVAPVLTSLTPARAPAGATVTLSGTDFGAQQGSGFVSFGAVSAVVSSWSDTSIDVVVPDVGDCDVAVTQNGVASGALAFDRIYPPAITSVTPSAALVGSTVIITGSGFETVQGLGSVTFGGVPATVTSWSDTAISAVVPGDGPIVVTQNGFDSVPSTFLITPVLTSISPVAANAGAELVLSGTDFGAAQGDGEVTFGGVPAIVSSWSDTSITVIVPDVPSGDVAVVKGGTAPSNHLAFTRVYAPHVSHLTTSRASVGSTILVLGSGFGAVQGLGAVTFNGVPASIVSWSDSAVGVIVSGDGPVVVSQGGMNSNAVLFDSFERAVVHSLSALTGPWGSELTVYGAHFEDLRGSGYVSFGGVTAEVVSWSDTEIVVTVPDTDTGPVDVTQNGETSNPVPFDPYPLPVIASVSKPRGQVGDSITIDGRSFGASPGTLTLAGLPLTASSWSDDRIVFTVPGSAVSGEIKVRTDYGDSNHVAFKVFVAPMATSVVAKNPDEALSDGEDFVIMGSNFEATQSDGWVTWGGMPCPIVSWSDTQIVATVPGGAPAGYVGVWQNGVCSNGVWKQFTPVITSMSNWVAVIGDEITLTGDAFGTVKTSRSRVAVSGTTCEIVSWSDTQIVFKVPDITKAGYVGVYRDGIGSNGMYLVPAPRLSSLSSISLAPGRQLTIFGQGFGATQETGCVVKIGGVEVPVVSWSDSAIVVTVTEAAQTGYVGVYREWASSNGLWFLPAHEPVITSVDTTSAAAGQTVSVAGSNFYPQSAGSKVTVGGVSCPVVSWSPTQVVFTVPADAVTGYVGVWNYGLCSNGVELSILP